LLSHSSSKGPSSDTKGADKLLYSAYNLAPFTCEGKDAGFDSERLLAFVKDTLGARTVSFHQK
jgi:hypothetical protein